MALNRDLIYSIIIHGIILILISTAHFSSKRLRFYEVSLEMETATKVPDLRKRRVFKKLRPKEKKLIRGDEPVIDKPLLDEDLFQEKSELRHELKEEDFLNKDFSKDLSPEIPDREVVMPEKGEISGPVSERTILRKIYPIYPDIARLNGWEGDVELKFWVEKDGVVSKVEILKTSGYSVLDEQAVSSIKKWIFSPFDTIQWGKITFKFSLK